MECTKESELQKDFLFKRSPPHLNNRIRRQWQPRPGRLQDGRGGEDARLHALPQLRARGGRWRGGDGADDVRYRQADGGRTEKGGNRWPSYSAVIIPTTSHSH